ncbi:hypothetical protein BRC90_01990 [Halobacteriales archaeon QS_4_69_34]|nr:MAG: hypothetical protein BRC90_01990 [Halobacteriales archaeon QS_4_69_34]
MADIHVTSTSEEGFVTRSRVGDFELTIDATDEEGPNPNATLVADYASCYVPAFRVGGQQRGHDDLGRIEIDAAADLDDEDDLAAIRFDMQVEADLDDGEVDELVARGEDNCHVHAALRDSLHADIAVESGAF